jgi:hypothetical protein
LLLLLAKMFNQRKTKTVWPSGLRRWLKAPFRKGMGSNPTAVTPPSISTRKLAVLELLTVHVSSEVMQDLLLDIDIDAQITLLGSQAGYSSQTVSGSILGGRISCTKNRNTPLVLQPTRAATALPGASTKELALRY